MEDNENKVTVVAKTMRELTLDQGCVVNSEMTYKTIAGHLYTNRSCIVGWSDERGTHYCILLSLYPDQFGSLQFGLAGLTDLYVAIMGKGAHGFAVYSGEMHFNYIAAKLCVEGDTPTAKALSKFINCIIDEIAHGVPGNDNE